MSQQKPCQLHKIDIHVTLHATEHQTNIRIRSRKLAASFHSVLHGSSDPGAPGLDILDYSNFKPSSTIARSVARSRRWSTQIASGRAKSRLQKPHGAPRQAYREHCGHCVGTRHSAWTCQMSSSPKRRIGFSIARHKARWPRPHMVEESHGRTRAKGHTGTQLRSISSHSKSPKTLEERLKHRGALGKQPPAKAPARMHPLLLPATHRTHLLQQITACHTA